MMAIKYRDDTASQPNPLAQLGISIDLGLRGVKQMAYAATACPSRASTEEEWQASTSCLKDAQQIADGMPRLTRAALTESESALLAHVRFKDDPPPAPAA